MLLDHVRRSLHLLLDLFALMAMSRTPCRRCFLLVIRLLVVILFVMMLRMLCPGVLVEVLPVRESSYGHQLIDCDFGFASIQLD